MIISRRAGKRGATSILNFAPESAETALLLPSAPIVKVCLLPLPLALLCPRLIAVSFSRAVTA
jgi:hypothetical protein